MRRIVFAFLIVLSFCRLSAAQDIVLDADTPATGSNLVSTPLVTTFGTITYVGDINTSTDPESTAAGSVGSVFDGQGCDPATAELFFDFDVSSITFIYGGNGGEIYVEARDSVGGVIDSFSQADTGDGQPAGPVTLSGAGIRSLYWRDNNGCFVMIDNVEIDAATSVPTMNEWGMIIFMALAGVGSVYYLRKKKIKG